MVSAVYDDIAAVYNSGGVPVPYSSVREGVISGQLPYFVEDAGKITTWEGVNIVSDYQSANPYSTQAVASPTGLTIPGTTSAIPNPLNLIPGMSSLSSILPWAALLYGGMRLFRGRKDLLTIGALGYGALSTGILNSILPRDSSGKINVMPVALSALSPMLGQVAAFGIGVPLLAGVIRKFMKGRRRSYSRRSFRRPRVVYIRPRYRRY